MNSDSPATHPEKDKRRTEWILNAFREADGRPLTTAELADELGVVQRTAQNYVRDLEENDHLVLSAEAGNFWRLADAEPHEPIYHPKLAQAKRWGNRASAVGNKLFLIAVSLLSATGIVTSNHVFARGMGIPLPFVRDVNAVVAATWFGVGGSLLFGLAFVALFFSLIFPRYIAWRLDDHPPEDL